MSSIKCHISYKINFCTAMNAKDILIISMYICWLSFQNVVCEDLSPAKIEKYPFMALLITTLEDVECGCGGLYVSKDYIVTVAHCLDYRGPETRNREVPVKEITAIMGVDKWDNTTSEEIETTATSTIVHPRYFLNVTAIADFAVVRIEKPFRLTEVIQFAEINFNKTESGKVTIVTWEINATTTEINQTVVSAQLLDLTADITECPKKVPNRNFLCVKAKCFTDTGSFLIQENKVIALSSFANGCTDEVVTYETLSADIDIFNMILAPEKEAGGEPTKVKEIAKILGPEAGGESTKVTEIAKIDGPEHSGGMSGNHSVGKTGNADPNDERDEDEPPPCGPIKKDRKKKKEPEPTSGIHVTATLKIKYLVWILLYKCFFV